MKRISCLALILLLCMTACAGRAEEEFFVMESAVTLFGDQSISTAALKKEMTRQQLILALSYAAEGREYDIMDSLNILDLVSKVLFDMEQSAMIRNLIKLQEPEDREVTAEEEAQLRAQAKAEWEEYRAVARSENGMAFLPAGNYVPVPDDPEETITRYFESFGLTEESLYQDALNAALDQKLMQAETAFLEDATEDEKFDYYTDWLLNWFSLAGVQEDPLAVAEVCLRLKDGK